MRQSTISWDNSPCTVDIQGVMKTCPETNSLWKNSIFTELHESIAYGFQDGYASSCALSREDTENLT